MQTQRKIYNATYTSVALKREDYEDISKLSKLNPSSVICEVMNEDGRMARLNDLFKFSKKHKIKLASIEDIISYRLKYEKLIKRINSKTAFFNNLGKINIYSYKNK